jgi:hypothetical protein
MDEQKIYDVAKIYEDSARRNDAINKRLTLIAVTAIICCALVAICMTGFYFFSDYQYPTAEQQIEDGDMSQKIGGETE